ncbi:unnamed protein product [Rangifer tarandus platyrhynchus]|uniref:Uncharacterized protein n=2 Tax=Rangifer tarandus platyrhynchus TaxID=3082113 RepID=A0ABN8Z337_RANTA|nr:unnamed protein product [Rangifer tarandus platyrhynchus]CAI9703616.1 unnamed protein product [Rangifer tarandus platyrhynchus]
MQSEKNMSWENSAGPRPRTALCFSRRLHAGELRPPRTRGLPGSRVRAYVGPGDAPGPRPAPHASVPRKRPGASYLNLPAQG